MEQPDSQENRKAIDNQHARKRYLSNAVRVGCAVLGAVSAIVAVPVGSASATDAWPPECSDLPVHIFDWERGEGAAVTSSSEDIDIAEEVYILSVDDAVLLDLNDASRMGCLVEISLWVGGSLISPYWSGGTVPVGVEGEVIFATSAGVVGEEPIVRISKHHLHPDNGLYQQAVIFRLNPDNNFPPGGNAVVAGSWIAFSLEPEGATVPEGMARIGISSAPVLRFVDG